MKTSFLLLLLIGNFISTKQYINSKEFTIIDIQSSVALAILDRLDPGVKKTQARYFQKMLESKALNILVDKFKATNTLSLVRDEKITAIISKDFQNIPNPLSIKSAIKKLKKADIIHDAYLQLTTRWFIEDDLIGVQKLEPRVKPNLEVVVKIFDASGKQTQKRISRGVVPEFIQIDDFNKSAESNIDQLVEYLKPLLTETIERTIDKLETIR